jgi:hypothetical protein
MTPTSAKDLDAVLKEAADAIHTAFDEKRSPAECGRVRALLDRAEQLRREARRVSTDKI